MANADLKAFIETRLQVLDPTIDLSTGSPAQSQFVDPLLAYLGTDPFETDIQSFILDRMAQEFPDVFAGDPGVVRDTFVKPLILLMEPFKRETQLIKNNQSLRDASILSDDDADALVANFFETRSAGGIAAGVVRVYYANPVNVTVEVTTRFFSSSGLNFYPANPSAISAEEMVFNREGSLYFLDTSVQAEATGDSYNVDANTISGVTGLYGVLKVNNPSKFQNGSPKVDTPTFVANSKQALNERSMVTRRGATARLNELFQTSVRAIQTIGAGDPEMQRDIMVATSPGHAWLTGVVTIYKNIAMVQCRTVDDQIATTAPVAGDELYLYIDRYSNTGAWASLPQNQRFMRFPMEEVIAGPMVSVSSPFQTMFFVRFSDPKNLLTSIVPPIYPSASTKQFEGGFTKKGTIQVSSLPSVGEVSLEANNQDVHILGHTDIYARPILQNVSNVVISNLVDDPGTKYFTIQKQTLQSYGTTAGQENKVTDTTGFNFAAAGVVPGDTIVIESGNDAGTYPVISVVGTSVYLGSKLSSAATALRYRVYKGIHVNPFEPKIPRVPFGTNPNNDLQTSIGSKNFIFNGVTTDLVSFGVKVGDTLRVLNGVDAGDFIIEGIVDGKHISVNRAAGGSNSGLSYNVFTPLNRVQAPLVRIKQMLVLDSAQQSTGVEIPYADPVAVVPSCDFTTAQVRGKSSMMTGVVLPQLNDGVDDFILNGSVAALSGDRRYSMGFDQTNGGIYKAMLFADGGATQAEFLLPADASTDGCSYFLSVIEDSSLAVNFPPVDPKKGDALTLKSGPNKGSYLIRDVVKFKYLLASGNSAWVYFIKIYGTFPVDVLRQVIKFCDDAGATVPKVATIATQQVAFPGFFQTTYNNLGTYLNAALGFYSATSPGAVALQAAVDAAALTDYEWGDPARGTLRSYFASPTLFQQNTSLNPVPTLYSYKTASGEILKFRADPNLYPQAQLVPSRLTTDIPVTGFPRDVIGAASVATFTDAVRPTMFQLGIHVGDILNVHAEHFFHGSDGTTSVSSDHQTAVGTTTSSNIVKAPTTASGSIFTTAMTGGILYIDEGDDAGAYTIMAVPDGYTLQLDRPLTINTPALLVQGNSAEYGWDGTIEKVFDNTAPFAGMTNKWLTLYGIDSRYQGSYLISAVSLDFKTVTLTRNFGVIGHFPAYPASGATARWVVTDAPLSAPNVNTASKGTQLYGLRPIRIYGSVPTVLPITAVPTDLSSSTITVTGTVPHGVKQPFQIYRPNIRRVTPKEMSANSDGPLFFFDTEALSMGPESGNNLSEWTSYLTVDPGTYSSLGYKHIVDDSTLTYSTKESGVLQMSPTVLPVESADSLDNMLNLVGIPIQVSYEYGEVIQQIQDFITSTEDRVTAANMLSRHFLPTYVSYDATYAGGSAPSVIAKDVINYLDNLAIETPIDVSLIEELIANRGGNVDTPTKVIINIHDWDRRQWVEFSQNEIGGTTTNVPYNGSARVSYFIPGKDASGQTGVTGERILLTRR